MARIIFPGVLGLLLCVGCGSAAQPTVRFKSADVDGITADGMGLRFNVDVSNPNSFPLPVSAATYNLRLGGVSVVDGVANPTGSIPAEGQLPVTIPINVGLERLLSAERALIESKGNVPYELDGSLEFSAGPLKAMGQSVRVPIKFNGVLPLRDAIKDPAALLKTPAGRKLVEAIIGKSFLGDLLGK